MDIYQTDFCERKGSDGMQLTEQEVKVIEAVRKHLSEESDLELRMNHKDDTIKIILVNKRKLKTV